VETFNNKKVGREPDCFCKTCNKDIHHLGIASHRSMHRRKKEKCLIIYSTGRMIEHDYAKTNSNKR
jgi:hypothetical protein